MHATAALPKSTTDPFLLERAEEALDALARAQRRLLVMLAASDGGSIVKRDWHLAIAHELVAHAKFVEVMRMAADGGVAPADNVRDER